MDYSSFRALAVVVTDGVARVTMTYSKDNQPAQYVQHEELGRIWPVLDRDPDVKVVLITGTGEEFYFSGRPGPTRDADWNVAAWLEREVPAIFNELVNFGKPLVAAINGTASGAGLTVALLSDISIMAEDAILFDPHVMLGISAGDGAAALLPLFAGMAKAKLYLMTSDSLDGREAERIGLVSRAVARADVDKVAEDYVERLKKAPAVAMRFTKRSIHQWLKLTSVASQDYAFALEALSFFSNERKGAPYTDFPPRKVP